MLPKVRWLLARGVGVLLVLVLAADVASRPDHLEGDQWIAWTPRERDIYVSGFIEGYWGASHDACRLADDLFELGKPHRLGEESSGRC
jgi:hypothetical protein